MSVGGLSAIAEQQSRGASIDASAFEDIDEIEDEGDESDEMDGGGGELQRGMEGERVLKSGFLLKKQERRKVSSLPMVHADTRLGSVGGLCCARRNWPTTRMTGYVNKHTPDRRSSQEYSLKRVLDLRSVQTVAPVTVKKHSFAFGIVTSKRTFLAKASSQDEMDDWVRAINQARRKLSERHEEEHVRRAMAQPMAVPPGRSPQEPIETHPGTFSSAFTTGTAGSYSSPQGMTGSYFTPKAGGLGANAGVGFGEWGGSHAGGLSPLPPSPMDTSNLSNQVSLMSLAQSPSLSTSTSGPRMTPSRMVSSSTQREPSSSSIGSSEQFHLQAASGAITGAGASSDEEEQYSSDPALNPLNIQQAPVDPNKVILSAYLMKRSKGRGRKVWRKRWFYLTSQGLTYTKSHMVRFHCASHPLRASPSMNSADQQDPRPLRYIPLSNVLDALEFDPESSAEDPSDSESDMPNESALGRSFTSTKKSSGPSNAKTAPGAGGANDEHLFRICTATKTLVLCAPTEEDEIKWLAAFRALLSRQRERSTSDHIPPGEGIPPRIALPPAPSQSQGQGQGQMPVPLITQQPPTPASLPPKNPDGPEPSPTGTIHPPAMSLSLSPSVMGAGTGAPPSGPTPIELPPPVSTPSATAPSTSSASGLASGAGSAPGQGQGYGPGYAAASGGANASPSGRGRSATYIAKGAVADVIRRFHPETHHKELPATPGA